MHYPKNKPSLYNYKQSNKPIKVSRLPLMRQYDNAEVLQKHKCSKHHGFEYIICVVITPDFLASNEGGMNLQVLIKHDEVGIGAVLQRAFAISDFQQLCRMQRCCFQSFHLAAACRLVEIFDALVHLSNAVKCKQRKQSRIDKKKLLKKLIKNLDGLHNNEKTS